MPATPGFAEITDVVARPGPMGGRGLLASEGARIEGSAVLVAGARGVGIEALDPGSTVRLSDAVVADTSEANGAALQSADGAQVTLSSGQVLRSAAAGTRAQDSGSVSLTDVVLAQSPMAPEGDGLIASDGSQVTLVRVELRDFARAAIEVRDGDTRLDAFDLTIRGVAGRPGVTAPDGFGLVLRLGASAVIAGMLVEGAAAAAVLASERASDVMLTDVTVDAGAETPTGSGLIASAGGSIVALRCVIRDAAGVAGGAFGAGSLVELRHARITRVHPSACEAPPCAAVGFGAYGGASLTATTFLESDCESAGAQTDGLGSLDLSAGLIERATVGIERPTGSSVRLEGVVLTDCGLDVSTSLGPAPSAPSPPD